jgi:hypothetical protein
VTEEYANKVRLACRLCLDGTPGPRWTVSRLMHATGLTEDEVRAIDEMANNGCTEEEILEEMDFTDILDDTEKL